MAAMQQEPSRTLSVSVVVPSYRRPQDLKRCLEALRAQTRTLDEVVVVLREDDLESRAVVQQLQPGQPIQIVLVREPGQVHALNCGLQASRGDIIAITDDDAAPRPQWLERTVCAFEQDSRVGGVGGRDWVHHGGRVESGMNPVVGRLQWFGRSIGNHHLGAGEAREVHFLKGANMSYRRAAIGPLRFDTRLRGSGAQVCNDMAFSLSVRRRGWKLIYDPEAAVDHFPAERFDEDRRGSVSGLACENAAFNYALVVSEAVGPLRASIFLIWAVTVGTRGAPGLLQVVRLLGEEGRAALVKASASLAGTFAGWRTALFRP
jgi:cellulose synthase/poly-beta-1,6-N-acetylglucosamine synthase-like glycosyltransferase